MLSEWKLYWLVAFQWCSKDWEKSSLNVSDMCCVFKDFVYIVVLLQISVGGSIIMCFSVACVA